MPLLELEDPQLQALGAVQQKIAPLIARRMLGDITSISNLAVSNSRRLFKYEVDQIFLCVPKGQDLPQDDYNVFVDDIHRFFQLLENLIDEQALGTSNSSADAVETEHQSDDFVVAPSTPPSEGQPSEIPTIYPKLEALIKRASDESISFDPSTLLCLPKTVEESKKVEKTITDFNAANIARLKAATRHEAGDISYESARRGNSLDEPISKFKLERIEKSRQSLSNMLNALKEGIDPSTCSSNHIAKLQAQHPDGSTEFANKLQHKIFLSCCSVKDKWQETTCTVVSESPPPDLKFKDIRNICKTIRNALNNERTLNISVLASRILRHPGPPRIIRMPPIWPTLSLEDLLVSGQSLTPYHKVVLALNLSYALLRMFHSGMQNRQWTAGDIFFLFDPPEGKVHEAYNPYLALSLMESENSKDTELASSIKFSILVHFAKILLEIALERPLGPFNRRPDIALLEVVEESDLELAGKVGPWYVKAATACLEANVEDDDDDSDYDDYDDDENGAQEFAKPDNEEQCRNVILTVITHLEDARTLGFPSRRDARKDPKRDPNYAHELLVSRIFQSRSAPQALEQPPFKGLGSLQPVPPRETGQNIVNIGSPGDLFDDARLRIDAIDSYKVALTDDFFNRADEFQSEIRKLPGNRRIRIAVLDTGVDENNSFFRGVRYSRRSRDTPFKEVKSFVGEPKTDTFGHGTNVAALILRVAPEADLYIAKISHSKQVDQAGQIAEAIKWAQGFNVHIITMSFGLVEKNDAIKDAIEKAEYDGVIMFAAASNYGGNTGRAFPARLEKVLCVHASDGSGNTSGMDPSPKIGRENFSTLGVAIPSVTEKGIYLSGTSYSTPVAAGIAANVLRFVQHLTDTKVWTEEYRKEAFTRTGMKNILLAMSNPRHGYHYIAPWWKMWDKSYTEERVAWMIMEAMKEDMY